MRIVFCSNFLSAHQRPLCDALYELTDGHFHFVAGQPFRAERKRLGWTDDPAPYVIPAYESKDTQHAVMELVKTADAVIISGDMDGVVLRTALDNPNTMVFRCNERVYKHGRWHVLSPRGWIRFGRGYYRHPKKRLYMLCNGAYVAGDYALFGAYWGHCYKWAYFTAVPSLDIETVLAEKDPHRLLWAGRLLDWKHPERALEVAAYLKEKQIPFQLDIVGDGPMRPILQREIEKRGLGEQVHLLGALPQEETYAYMQRAAVFLATSDRQEGWGAVVNEAMSRGCAVVACDAMGSVPYLIKNGHNGFSYPFRRPKALCRAVERLLTDDASRHNMGAQAYRTMRDDWTPTLAAQRLIALITALQKGEKTPFSTGPCSRAEIV